tara:strand:- start:373 stop:660 length:288 start_codon:yes stop_codon:yes gene_type:complete
MSSKEDRMIDKMGTEELLSVGVLAVGVVLHAAWGAWADFDEACRRAAEAEVDRFEQAARGAGRLEAQAAVLYELGQAGGCAPSSTWSSALRCGGE